MSLKVKDLVDTLEKAVPTELAADWDNVGLLIEGPPDRSIGCALVCIDLTHPVLDEALQLGANAIVAYHPPIFSGIKRLNRRVPGQHLLLRLIEAGITVWSPHTALDAAAGGMGDWLLDSLGDMSERSVIEPCVVRSDDPTVGMGRVGRLSTPGPLSGLLPALKSYLGLEHVRVARAARHRDGEPITKVAVCPGAGGSLFSSVRKVDLLLTGEMRHHDVLNRVARGTSVVLTDHTNTERGFMPLFAESLREKLGIDVHVSGVDADPLVVV